VLFLLESDAGGLNVRLISYAVS